MPRTATPVSISFDDEGSGEPALLLLPGWCAPRTLFRPLVPLLARHRRVLTLDWRGHGGSDPAPADFGVEELVEDAEAVIEASGAEQIIPIAHSHAGWAAIELRRRLGWQICRFIFLDWLVLGAPPPFLTLLEKLQSPEEWRQGVRQLFLQWLPAAPPLAVERYVKEEMGAFGFDMWARAARAIETAYRRDESPLNALGRLAPPISTAHLYAQPDSSGFLTAQEAFSIEHPWFQVRRLTAKSHFPALEIPQRVAQAIEAFSVTPQYLLTASERLAA